jgi:hypothetical protein
VSADDSTKEQAAGSTTREDLTLACRLLARQTELVAAQVSADRRGDEVECARLGEELDAIAAQADEIVVRNEIQDQVDERNRD